MGTVCTKCCKKTNHTNDDALSILVLGIENAGKTEIAFKVCHRKRGDFAPTKGCRLFETVIADTDVKLIEIGGGSDLRDIWKYYFLDALAVIFVIDASNINNICESYKIFQNLMAHEFLVGKPFLILANKQDLPESVDCIDICEYLDVEYLANRYRCPCLVEASGNWINASQEANEYDGLNYGVQWLVKTVLAHRQFIMNRINFHKQMINRNVTDGSESIKRPRTGVKSGRRKLSKDSRPKTAPSSHQAWLRKNDNNYLTKRNSVISVKSIPSSTTTERTSTERTINSSSKPTTEGGLSVVDEALEVSHSSSGDRPPIFIIRKEEMTLEDLSLSFSVNEMNGKAVEIS
ncbi:ADP-ribosylation factor-like protein 13B [Anopheles bellator]|uniref:ADP-ribosylation factor-like protein 13B n=1 Tax=Anopheles bellator TaxID=139047 RepID=UPI0026473CA5|nr:ADP-ribosylation factor-like protein 13B [Anopheles bellator]